MIYYEDNNKIEVTVLPNGAKVRKSVNGLKIRNKDTDKIYDEAYDVIDHSYEETDIPVEVYEEVE